MSHQQGVGVSTGKNPSRATEQSLLKLPLDIFLTTSLLEICSSTILTHVHVKGHTRTFTRSLQPMGKNGEKTLPVHRKETY